MSICLFIPLRKELKHAKSVLGEYGNLSTKKASVVTYKFNGILFREKLNIQVCLIDDMGNWPTAAYVAWALGRLKPKIAILAGIAGSLDEESLPIGSVVLSNRAKSIYANKVKRRTEREVFVEEYDAEITDKIQIDVRERLFEDSFFRNKRRYYDPVPMDLQAVLDEIVLRSGRSNASPEVIKVISSLQIGQIFSGDLVIDCPDAINYILEKVSDDQLDYYIQSDSLRPKGTDASYERADWNFEAPAAVDMESAGFLHAVQIDESGVSPYIVRGISDVCAKKSDDHQALASRNAIVSALVVAEVAHYLGAAV